MEYSLPFWSILSHFWAFCMGYSLCFCSILSHFCALGLLNINSLKKHIDELRIAAPNLALDIIAINETRLDQSYHDGLFSLNGYNLIRLDRDSRGGGVCLYLKSTLNFIHKTEFEVVGLELLAVEIKQPNSKPFLVITWYRPPNSNAQCFDKFRDLIQNIDNKYDEIYILGDLNCNLLANPLGAPSLRLLDILDEFQLEQIIDKPTRVTEHHKSLIDHLITNASNMISDSGVCEMSISDHNLVFIVRKHGIPRGNPKVIQTRNFKRFNEQKFINDIASVHWTDTSYKDVNEFWTSWKKSFIQVVDKHAPITRLRTRNKPSPWITPEIKHGMRERDILKKKASKSNNTNDWLLYKAKKNYINKLIRKTKKTYY